LGISIVLKYEERITCFALRFARIKMEMDAMVAQSKKPLIALPPTRTFSTAKMEQSASASTVSALLPRQTETGG